jgi:uroporphyrinogen III methyltransferase/synthase
MLEALGARVIECPMIEIVPVQDWTDVDNAILLLGAYDWLLFTSANAVDAFMKRAELAGVRCNVRVAAIGSVTESRLRDWDVQPAMVPEDFRAEGLLALFPKRLSGVRILFPRAETARELLPAELRSRGAQVDVVTVYRTVSSGGGGRGIREILGSEKVDCIVLTSSSTARYLAEALQPDPAAALRECAIAVIGPVTRETARQAGLNPAIESARSTIEDLVQAIDAGLAP